MSVRPGDLVVHGGVGGVAATYARVRGLADDQDDRGDRLRARGREVLELATEGDLVVTAVVSPGTFSSAEAALISAVWGPDGTYAAAAHQEADALATRAAVGWLDAADHLAADGVATLAHTVGRLAAPAVPAVAAPVATGLAAGHLASRLGVLPDLPDPLAGLGAAAVTRPGLVEPGIVALSGVVDTLTGRTPPIVGGLVLPVRPDVAGATVPLAAAYGPEVPPHVVRRADLETEVAPPRGVADLLDSLGEAAALSDAPSGSGTIAVDTLVGPDGGRRHVVHLPGTDDLASPPWLRDDDVRDLGTNARLLAGLPTAYGDGVVEAMRQAGVRPDEPVLLTGHSQGGMQAVALAAEHTPYDVRQVVVAGAPTAQVASLGDDVAVLALENRGDVVPLLDGAPAPDTPQRVTVTFDAPVAEGVDGPGVAERHGLGHYRDAAAAVDASADPSLRAQTERMTDLGFLDAEEAERRVFRITR